MKTPDFGPGDNIIDSRNVISRYEELESELESLREYLQEAKDAYDDFVRSHVDDDEDTDEELKELDEAIQSAQADLDEFDMDDFEDLKNLVEQAESSPDWTYGETLIHDDYFTEYTEELIRDCYELPKDFESGDWPWRHMEMDWESAAQDLKSDYMEVDYSGETYWIRG